MFPMFLTQTGVNTNSFFIENLHIPLKLDIYGFSLIFYYQCTYCTYQIRRILSILITSAFNAESSHARVHYACLICGICEFVITTGAHGTIKCTTMTQQWHNGDNRGRDTRHVTTGNVPRYASWGCYIVTRDMGVRVGRGGIETKQF